MLTPCANCHYCRHRDRAPNDANIGWAVIGFIRVIKMLRTVHGKKMFFFLSSFQRITTLFSSPLRYADLYASSVLNLLHYPFSYMFRAPAMLMPHESTVAHEQTFDNDVESKEETIRNKKKEFISKRADSKIPNMFALAPEKEITTPHELDDDPEEDSSSASSSN